MDPMSNPTGDSLPGSLDPATGEIRPSAGSGLAGEVNSLERAGVILPRLIGPEAFDFSELEAFVVRLVHDCERTPASWCPQWWKHPEAILVFHALHQAFKAKYKEDLDSWLLYDYGPQMSYLGSKEGPFSACSPKQHMYKNAKGNPDAAWQPLRDITLVDVGPGQARSETRT